MPRVRRPLCLLILACAVGGLPREARGTPLAELDVDVPRTLALTAAATAVWGTSELLKKPMLGAGTCRWCAPSFDGWIRDRVVWKQHAGDAVWLSNGSADMVAPLAAAGLTGLAAGFEDMRVRDLAVDFLVVAEATAYAADLNQLVKFSVARQRPFARAGLPDPDTSQVGRHDDNASFYSGHTSLAFVLAASAGTVATMRHYRLAPLIWITGAVVGAATAYLRMAADQHYFTDVLTGAVVGTGVGIAVPYYLHRPRERQSVAGLTLLPTPGGIAALYVW